MEKQWIIEEAVSEETMVEIKAQGKCTKLFVRIAEKNVKFRLNRQEINQFIAETAIANTKSTEYSFVDILNIFFIFLKKEADFNLCQRQPKRASSLDSCKKSMKLIVQFI